MRVVYIVSMFPCWSETFIVREILELRRLGVDVQIISLKHPSETVVQTDAESLLGKVAYPAPMPQSAIRALQELFRNPFVCLRMLASITKGLIGHPLSFGKSLMVWYRTLGFVPELRAMKPDHLHAHWATYPSTAALMLSRLLGKPFSFTSHAHDIFLEHQLLSEKISESSFCVTISQYNRHYLLQNVKGAEERKIRVIHCGVSLGDYAFRPEGRADARILAVGRLDEIKGFRYLVEACGVLAGRGHDFTCDIIGEGPLRQALSARIGELGLNERVRLRGVMKQEEVRQYLYSATTFVLPSVKTERGDMDGIPVALMEAMAVGTPVVSTTVSGIPELVMNGVNGLLAPPADPLAFANCIEQLLVNPEQARMFAQNARAHVEKEFDVRLEALKLYESIGEQQRATTA